MPFTLELGQPAPDFDLPGVDGRRHRLADYADARLLVVAFSCNHCPYVIGSEDRMIAFAMAHAPQGVRMIAINSNESEMHPTDSFDHMVERAKAKGFPFPYLHDETQEVALAYGALRTPHYYVFAKSSDEGSGGAATTSSTWVLHYTGRMDDNPRHPGMERTRELADAVEDLLGGLEPRVPVTNPVGCNVKWKGKPHKWMPADACDLV